MILAIETSSLVCGVSLHDAENCVAETYLEEERVHAERLAGMTAELLESQSVSIPALEAVLVSAGPGSFTGLRIGMSFAKGLVYPQRLPLAAVNTMQAYISGTEQDAGSGEKTVWVIRSHRDFYYMSEKSADIRETKIIYDKFAGLKDHFPACRHIICNSEINPKDPGIRFTRRSILPSMIGGFYRRYTPDAANRDYDHAMLDYGMDYKPRQWEGGDSQ